VLLHARADPRHQRTIAKTVRGGLERIQAHQLLQSGNCQDQERCTEAVREARRSQAHGPLRVPSLLCWKIPINAARALPPEHASGGRAMSALPGEFNESTQHLLILADEEVCEWRGMHGPGSRRNRRLSCGSAGRAVNVLRTSRERLRGGTRAASIGSWLAMEG